MLKVKILIFPLSIVFAIWLLIWSIVPDWNEIQAKKTQKADLEKKLSTLNSKNTKVSQLLNEINSNEQDRDLVYTFIPNGVKEEEIIDTLNFLASNESNLFVYNLSVPLLNKYSNPSLLKNNLSTTVEVNFGIVGSYENIKLFLGKVATLKRYNNVNSLKIEKEKNIQIGTEKSDSLNASGVLSFNYFIDDGSTFNYEDPLFSEKGMLGMGTISDIRQKTSTEIMNLQIGAGGKSNPFAL